MSYKRLLTYQDDSAECPQWTRIAAAFAHRFSASLTGLHAEAVTAPNSYDADISAALRERQNSLTSERDRRVRNAFEESVKGYDLKTHWRSITGDAASIARRAARFFDLALIGQSDESAGDVYGERRVLEHIVLGAGRPVVVVPRGWTKPVEAKKVVVAWDGSREAVRALHDAMPLLSGADEVFIATVLSKEDRRPNSEDTPRELAALLKEHGIDGSAKVLPSDGRRPGKVLLEFAVREGADMIVLGAYGHSRFREIVLGGVTRHILRNTTVPVLMSH